MPDDPYRVKCQVLTKYIQLVNKSEHKNKFVKGHLVAVVVVKHWGMICVSLVFNSSIHVPRLTDKDK